MIVNGAIDTSAFSFTGGSAGGTGAVRINDAGSLTFTGSPSGGNFQFIANGTMTGNVPSGATVMLKPTAGVAGAYSVTSGGIINNGTIVLSAQNADHDVTWNVVTFGAVATNNGTITIDPGPGGGGGRTITNILSNTATGVLNINTNATLGRLNNSGTVHVAPGKALSFSALSISLSNSAGIIDVAPGGALNVGGMQLSGGDILLAGDPANPASLLMSGMMTYTGAATPAQILTGPGTLRGRMVLSGAAAFNIADGAAPIDTLITADITGGPLIKQGAGTLGVERLNGIPADISAGTVRVTSSNAAAYLSALTVASAAALDLRDNDLVVDSASFSTIRQLVIDGFGTTAGITSSTSDGSQILALFDNALVGQSQWQGQPIAPSAIVGKYTYFGDMNIDGQVTGDDYTVIDAHLNTTPAVGLGWLNGDANVDGVVTGDDYTVIDANLGLGAGNPLTPSAIPEPAAGLMLLGSAAWLRMRRTHQTARKQRVFNGLLIH
jgi:hypothetical protein